MCKLPVSVTSNDSCLVAHHAESDENLPKRSARNRAVPSNVSPPMGNLTSVEDGLQWLRPIRELGIVDFSVSDDELHRLDKNDRRAEFARQAAQKLGIPTGTICIEPPSVSRQVSDDNRGKPVIGGGVLFKGRAAEKLTAGLPVRLCKELTTCPHEDLLSPERVHVDAYGNVHLCQGLSMGNIWEKALPDVVHDYDAHRHPIAGPLLRGGPIGLVKEHGLAISDCYVDECHLCYTARKQLLPSFPEYLAPEEAYGL